MSETQLNADQGLNEDPFWDEFQRKKELRPNFWFLVHQVRKLEAITPS